MDTNGNINTIAGGGTNWGEDYANSVTLQSPSSIDFTPSGEMLVAEEMGSRKIRKMDHTGFMTTIAGGGMSTNDDIPAKTASIIPLSVVHARDGTDDIFIAHQMGLIFKLTMLECFDVKVNNASVCSGHGSCTAPDTCQCDSEWNGNDCSITSCFVVMSNEPSSVVCSGHGSCVAPDQCECNDGWTGVNCSIPSCFGVPPDDTARVCSGHGSCIGLDQCECDDDNGVDCSITHCFGITSNLHERVCSGKGKCIGHNNCECRDGFRGHKCHRARPS